MPSASGLLTGTLPKKVTSVEGPSATVAAVDASPSTVFPSVGCCTNRSTRPAALASPPESGSSKASPFADATRCAPDGIPPLSTIEAC
jgi:hypothetical protein